MWLMVLFDLPVLTKREKKIASGFRLSLLDLGFEMSQYSVYLRFCASHTIATTHVNYVQSMLPPMGKVTILTFTDKQFERAVNFQGQRKLPAETGPKQLEIF